jgi:hypothetical protein
VKRSDFDEKQVCAVPKGTAQTNEKKMKKVVDKTEEMTYNK